MPLAVAADRIRSGLSPKNTWRRPSPSAPISRSASTWTLSKNRVYCFSGRGDLDREDLLVQPGGVGVHHEEGQPAPAGVRVDARAGHHQDRLALVRPRRCSTSSR